MTLEEKEMARYIADRIRSWYGKGSLNLTEFAEYLGLSYQTVRKRILAGQLPGQGFAGGSFLIPVDSIAIWEVAKAYIKNKGDGF